MSITVVGIRDTSENSKFSIQQKDNSMITVCNVEMINPPRITFIFEGIIVSFTKTVTLPADTVENKLTPK